jgi:hypothetical protein
LDEVEVVVLLDGPDRHLPAVNRKL